MKVKFSKLLFTAALLSGCSNIDSSGLWLARDDAKMAQFMGTTTTIPFYCFELNPKSNEMQIQFLDSTQRFQVALQKVSRDTYELTKGEAKRRFVIRKGSIEGHAMLNFLDFRPIDANNPGGRDASKTDYANLDECVKRTLAQLKEDEESSTENIGGPAAVNSHSAK